MEAQIIEKWNRQRYNGWALSLVGLLLAGGIKVFEELTGNHSTISYVVEVAGVAIILIGYVLQRIVLNKMKRDSRLKEALDNELYKLYNYKIYVWAFYALVISLVVLTWILQLKETENVVLFSIFMSGITATVARIVYYHNGHE